MANITRIKNNQITDSTITYTKIAPGTLVGSVFNANITLNSNVTIVGNLAVSGSTTTVQSTNTYINDPLVIFNNGYASVPAYDIGILVNRNLTATAPYGSVNAALVWQEAAKGFAAIMTTETGTTQGAINNSGYANVFLGNTYANTIQVRDNTVSSSSTTGALVVTGGVGVGGALNVGGAFGVTGNLTTTAGGVISGATTGYLFNETATTINLGAAATTINAGNSGGTTNWLGIFKHSGNIVAQSTTDSTSLTTGSIVTLGGLAVAKNITASSSVTTTAVATNFSTGNARISGGYVDGTAIGSTTANTGAFTTLTTTGTIISGGNVVANSGTASTTTTTGAMVVAGGLGVTGNLNINSSGTNSYNLIKGNVGIGPSLTASTVDNLLTLSLNTAQIADQNSIIHAIGPDEGSTRVTLDAFGSTAISPAFTARRARGTAATPTAVQTGDRLLYVGGRGYGATGFSSTGRAYMAVYASEAWTDSAQGSHIDFGVTGTGTTVTNDAMTIASTGNVIMQAVTPSTSTTTGGLIALGGAGIAGNLNVGGQVGITGTITAANLISTNGGLISSSTTGYVFNETATTINMGAAATTINVGNASGTTNILGVTKHTGNLVAASTTASTNTTTGSFVAAGGAGIAGALNVGGATTISSSTGSTSTTTGALIVTGGTGIGGNLNVGGSVVIAGNLTVQGTSTTVGTQDITIQDSIINLHSFANLAPLTTDDGRDIGIKFHYYKGADNHAFLGWANDTGSLEYYAAGSEGSGNTFVGTSYGTIKSGGYTSVNTTPSTSTTTGAITTAGGAGIAGNLYVGGLVQAGTAQFASINNTPIGNATPSTGAFTTLTASSTLGVTGVATLNGNVVAASGTASSSTTTGALVVVGGVGVSGNEWIGGTLNVAGATTLQSTLGVTGATTLSTATAGGLQAQAIGNVTPGTGAFTTLTSSSTITASGNIVAASGTASSSTTTGALVVVGGVGVSGALNVGGTSSHTGAATFGSTVTASGNVVAGSGTASSSTTTGALVVVGGAGVSGNATIGGDAVITGDAYIAGGDIFTSASTFNLLNATATTVNAFGAATTLNTGNASGTTNMSGVVKVGGNLVATSGTSSTNTTSGALVVTGGVGISGAVYTGSTITASGNIVAASTTDSSSTTTGSFVTAGGVGIAGNVYAGKAAVFNSSKTAGMDHIIKGASDDTLIWARPSATYDQVLIGNSATVSTLIRGAKLQINSTDSMLLPTGTTAQRPSNTGGSDVTGMFRYNTTLGYIEFYNGTTWQGVSTQFTVITDEQYNGDGSTTAFTMAASSTTSATIVSINGVIQIPTLAYSCSGTTLTFTEAPATGDVIDVRRLTTTQSITAISSTNGYMGFTADNNGAYITTGTGSAVTTTYWDTAGAQVSSLSNVSVASANTATTVDTFAHGTYRTAKYIVQVTNGANYQAMEALVVSNGTTATVTTYGIVQTNGNLGVLTATVSGSNTLLQFVAANATNNVRIKKDYLLV